MISPAFLLLHTYTMAFRFLWSAAPCPSYPCLFYWSSQFYSNDIGRHLTFPWHLKRHLVRNWSRFYLLGTQFYWAANKICDHTIDATCGVIRYERSALRCLITLTLLCAFLWYIYIFYLGAKGLLSSVTNRKRTTIVMKRDNQQYRYNIKFFSSSQPTWC